MARYLYLVPARGRAGWVETDALEDATERHAVRLEVSQARENAEAAGGVS